MTKEQFALSMGISQSLVERWYSLVVQTMDEYQINTPVRQAHFLGQVSVESNGFRSLSESLNYSVDGLTIFGARLSLQQREQLGRKPGEPALSVVRQAAIANLVYGGRYGNNQLDDGWNYRGRGLKQITFRANYLACGKALGLPLEQEPELLELDINAARSAGWFWQLKECNLLADKDEISALTRCINGGYHGLADRTRKTLHAMAVLL